MRHNDHYNASFDSNVEAAGRWIRFADQAEVEENLKKMGYLELSDYYYVVSTNQYPESFESFVDVVEKYGYRIDVIYEGSTSLLHLKK